MHFSVGSLLGTDEMASCGLSVKACLGRALALDYRF